MTAATQLAPLAGHLRGRAEAEQIVLAPSRRIGVLCFAVRRFHLILEHYGHVLGDVLLAELWSQLRREFPRLDCSGFRWSAGSLALIAEPAVLDALGAAIPPRLAVQAPAPFSAGRFGVTLRRFDSDGLTPRQMIAAMDRFAALPAVN